MHQIFFISEVFSEILEYLDEDGYFINEDGDLTYYRHGRPPWFASTARVCQAWFIPSVNILWRSMKSLSPLINILGTICYPRNSKEWKFKKAPRVDQWDRFYLYSSRVQTLTRSLSIDPPISAISANAIRDLSNPKHSFNGPLFPALQICGEMKNGNISGFHIRTVNEVKLVKALLSPQLSQLYLSFIDDTTIYEAFGDEDEGSADEQESRRHAHLQRELRQVCLAMEGLIELLPDRCPNLCSLGLQSELESAEDLSSMKAKLALTLQRLQHLEQFTLNELVIDGPSFTALGTLPRFRSLSLRCISSIENFEEGAECGSFAQLRELRLQGLGLDTNLLGAMLPTLSALRSISVCLRHPEQMRTMLGWISGGPLPVETLEMEVNGGTIENHHLQNLRHLPTLHDLTLDFTRCSVDDELSASLALAIPNIRKLHIQTHAGLRVSRRPVEGVKLTLHTLHHLSLSCLFLTVINLDVDARTIPATSQCGSRQISPLKLDFLQSLIGEPEAVAIWLRRCFGSGRGISVSCALNNDSRTKWTRVGELLLHGS